jgi:heme exporter protein D
MNISSASGGIVFVVLAAVWLIVAVPAMRERGIFRENTRSQRRQARIAEAAARERRITAAPRSASKSDIQQWQRDLEAFAAQQDKNLYVPVDPRAWSPMALPSPQTGRNFGELEQVEFADVHSFEAARAASLEAEKPIEWDASTIDEILRRRRANG